jgi:hypothetical protein
MRALRAVNLAKRWAFVPLLALCCTSLTSMAANPAHGSPRGAWLGAGLSIPIAVLIDRRRARRRG